MATYVLPTTVYQPPLQVRREARVTLIEDEVQINLTSYRYPSKLMITSPMADDVPTPRPLAATITPATDATSVVSSMWSQRDSKSSFDSLYDLTDSEGEEVPLKLSASVKKHVGNQERSRYPSIVIPSPSQWPSIHKPQGLLPVGLSPASKLASSSAFSVWQTQRLRVPSGTSTPSLDGSLTSEELALSSCPSTPDLASREEVVDEWEPPCQLHPDAFETLHQLSPEEVAREMVIETVLEVPEEASLEMREIIKTTPVRLDFALLTVDSEDPAAQDPISALSVPSPGGFFSSLAPVAAQTWAIRKPEPSTSVAEKFYGVPWRGSASEQHQRVRTTTIVTSALPSGPPTAIKDVFSSIDPTVEVAEIIPNVRLPLSSEYNEQYQEKLKQSALAHFERTKGWLEDQFTMVSKEVMSPTTPNMTSPSLVSANNSPSKKSVRFAPGTAPSPRPSTNTTTTVSAPASPSVVVASDVDTDFIFLAGFRSIMSRRHASDVFVHRQSRLETMHIQRRNFQSAYLRTLHNDFEIAEPSRPVCSRPISTMLPTPSPEDDEKRETIAAVERERQVLEQVSPQFWELEALSYIRGGALLTKEITAHMKSITAPQILDFGGKPNADWGWCIATSFPTAKVCTVYFDESTEILGAPCNHVSVYVDKPYSLPFADNTFDVISTRTLHSLLKTEHWTSTLGELHRVLKPSGYLDFSLIDALLSNVTADCWGQVMNAEFGYNLQQRGYEREPTKHFLERLEDAGFRDVKRMWMFLGMGEVQPTWKDEGKTIKSPMVAQAPNRALPANALPAPPAALVGVKGGKKPTQTDKGTAAKKLTSPKKSAATRPTPATLSKTSSNSSSAPPNSPDTAINDETIKPAGTIHHQTPMLSPSGEPLLDASGKPSFYPPAYTGSTAAVGPVTGLLGARLWEQWVYRLAREMGGEDAEVEAVRQVCGVLEQGGKVGSGVSCLVGVCRKEG